MTISSVFDEAKGAVWFYSFIFDLVVLGVLVYFFRGEDNVTTFMILAGIWFGLLTIAAIRRMAVRHFVTKHQTREKLEQFLSEKFSQIHLVSGLDIPECENPLYWTEQISMSDDFDIESRLVAARLSGQLEFGEGNWEPLASVLSEEAYGILDKKTRQRMALE